MSAIFKAVLFCTLAFGVVLPSEAQSQDATNSSPLIPGSEKTAPPPGSPEAELYHRAAIRREEEAHKEMLERAREAARLGSEIKLGFDKRHSLGGEDLKKLERLEKLTKQIRGGAGGDDDDEPLEDSPREAGAAVLLLAEASDALQKDVEKTSRLVTSAGVIKRSNELLKLIRHVKTFSRQ